MADHVINVKIQEACDLEENWKTLNPIPLKGQMCVLIDKNLFKFGDGEKTWSALEYCKSNIPSSDNISYDSNTSIRQAITELKAAVNNLNNTVDKITPKVGDLYFTVSVDENPADKFGGTWQLFNPGRTVVCIDESQEEFNTIGKTGGSKFLQSHVHDFSASTESAGSHTHVLSTTAAASGKNDVRRTYIDASSSSSTSTSESGDHTHAVSGTTEVSGSGNAQNLQPYAVCYIWERIS